MDEDVIRSEILQGLLQVDDTFVITEFVADHDKPTRHLTVSFKAQNAKGETVSEVISYA